MALLMSGRGARERRAGGRAAAGPRRGLGGRRARARWPGPTLAERCRAAGAELHADLLPRASEVLALARLAVAAGQILDPADALPVYVRDRVTRIVPVIKLQ